MAAVSTRGSFLTLFVAAVFLFLGFAGAQKPHFSENCGKCDPESCPKLSNCIAGSVTDVCGCCQVCGLTEGEKCDNNSLRLPYKNKYGFCGDNLECLLRPDLSPRDEPEALCFCKEQQVVCGSNNRTYDSVCELREEAFRKNFEVATQMKHWGPCRSAPWIVSGPDDSFGSLHQGLALDCEAKGYPIPSISWEFRGDDGSVRMLPSDDLYVAVQVRGGPEPFMATSWVQIVDLRPTDTGTYTCVVTNTEGQARATAKVGVYRK